MSGENLGEKLLVDNLEQDNLEQDNLEQDNLGEDKLGEDKLDVECRECPIDLDTIKPNTALVIKDEDGSEHFFNEKGLREWLKENNINPLTRANVSLSGDNVNVRYETGEPAYDVSQYPIDKSGERIEVVEGVESVESYVRDITGDPVIMGGGHNARATDRQDNLEDDGYINYFKPLKAVRDDWWGTMHYIKDRRSWCATLINPLKLVGIIAFSVLCTFAAIGASLVVAVNLTDKFVSDCFNTVSSNLPSFSFFRSNNQNNIERIGHITTGAVVSDNILSFGPGS